jgi:hypothetical protein
MVTTNYSEMAFEAAHEFDQLVSRTAYTLLVVHLPS